MTRIDNLERDVLWIKFVNYLHQTLIELDCKPQSAVLDPPVVDLGFYRDVGLACASDVMTPKIETRIEIFQKTVKARRP